MAITVKYYSKEGDDRTIGVRSDGVGFYVFSDGSVAPKQMLAEAVQGLAAKGEWKELGDEATAAVNRLIVNAEVTRKDVAKQLSDVKADAIKHATENEALRAWKANVEKLISKAPKTN